MNRSEIFEKLNEIAQNVFDDENISLNDSTTAKEVDGWDSLTHLIFINEIEVLFNIKFTLGEIQGFKNVGELVDFLIKHINNN